MRKPKDIARKVEDRAIESELIAKLATDEAKRERYEKRAERLHEMANRLQAPDKQK